jgi:hypothetical protein
MVCAGPQAVGHDCCSPPAPLPPIDCSEYSVICAPVDNFCALVFDVEPRHELQLVTDVPAIGGVDGRVFSRVTLVELAATITGLAQLPIRRASLYIGPKGLVSAASPEATLLGEVSLVAGKNPVELGPEAHGDRGGQGQGHLLKRALSGAP